MSLPIYSQCNPYVRIQSIGPTDRALTDIILCDKEISDFEAFSKIPGIANAMSSEIYVDNSDIFVVKQKWVEQLITKLKIKIANNEVPNINKNVGWDKRKISICSQTSKIEVRFISRKQELFFLVELKKVINKKLKKGSPKLIEYNEMLDIHIITLKRALK
jgi:hypothetical protein